MEEVIPTNLLGSYGEVFICYHKQTGCSRAVKILPKIDIDETNRCLREINAMKVMDHPNIIRLHETYEDSNFHYLVTEYLPSHT